jgi:hypothetical protein
MERLTKVNQLSKGGKSMLPRERIHTLQRQAAMGGTPSKCHQEHTPSTKSLNLDSSNLLVVHTLLHSHKGQVVQYDFLNCTAPPPCDTIGEILLDSACCQFKIPIFLAQGQGISGVTSIQWSLSGGTMESISPPLGCSYTLTPANPYGTTSGTITFSPPCTISPLNLCMEVNPTTATGQVTLYLTINHGPNKVCRDSIQLWCARAPITKCDSLDSYTFHLHQLTAFWTQIYNLQPKATSIANQTSRD